MQAEKRNWTESKPKVKNFGFLFEPQVVCIDKKRYFSFPGALFFGEKKEGNMDRQKQEKGEKQKKKVNPSYSESDKRWVADEQTRWYRDYGKRHI